MSQKIRIKLKSYDHNLVDKSAVGGGKTSVGGEKSVVGDLFCGCAG